MTVIMIYLQAANYNFKPVRKPGWILFRRACNQSTELTKPLLKMVEKLQDDSTQMSSWGRKHEVQSWTLTFTVMWPEDKTHMTDSTREPLPGLTVTAPTQQRHCTGEFSGDLLD